MCKLVVVVVVAVVVVVLERTRPFIANERERERKIFLNFVAGCYKIQRYLAFNRSPNAQSKMSTG